MPPKRKALDSPNSSSTLVINVASPAGVDAVSTTCLQSSVKCLRLIGDEFLCPITNELMLDPVTAPDGHTYERASITKWIVERGTSPLVPSLRMTKAQLYPARGILGAIVKLVESGDLEVAISSTWKAAKQMADLEKAKELLRNGHVLDAAKLGLPKAQATMAQRYRDGSDGVEKDISLYIEWATKAAEGGDAQGQNLLGLAYAQGQGVAKDSVVAIKWFELAAAQGRLDSCYNIGFIFCNGSIGVQQDYAKAVMWWRRAADGGHLKAQLTLGYCYLKGDGVPIDLTIARSWFKKSADQGNEDAMFQLGKMLIIGSGGSKEFKLGMGLISDSKDKGNEAADAFCEKIEELLVLGKL